MQKQSLLCIIRHKPQSMCGYGGSGSLKILIFRAKVADTVDLIQRKQTFRLFADIPPLTKTEIMYVRIWWNGRHAGFRFQSERVQVQLLLSAPVLSKNEPKKSKVRFVFYRYAKYKKLRDITFFHVFVINTY